MTILYEYVKLVWVCQTEVGISNLYRNVMLIRVCHTYTGMSNFTGMTYFCKLLSHFQEIVQLSREIQTFKEISAYKGMSHFHGNIKLSRKCQDSKGECHIFKGMSYF